MKVKNEGKVLLGVLREITEHAKVCPHRDHGMFQMEFLIDFQVTAQRTPDKAIEDEFGLSKGFVLDALDVAVDATRERLNQQGVHVTFCEGRHDA